MRPGGASPGSLDNNSVGATYAVPVGVVPQQGSREESYAQWVRAAIARTRASGGRLVALFESSVPEPVDLIQQIVARAFADPVTSRYTSAFSGGNPYVVDHLASAYGVGADHILCTTGATGALSLIYRSLVRPGERILVEAPGFDLFDGIARDCDIRVDHFSRRPPLFGFDPAEIEAKLRPDTRLVVLSNLHNPSGMAADHEALVALARIAEARGVLVLVDEVYGAYADSQARPCPAASLSPSLISVSSLTKIFGLSTLRCGWIVARPDVLGPVREMSEKFEFGISNLAHAVAALVLDETERFRDYAFGVIASARPTIQSRFAQWRGEGLIEGELPPFGCISFPRLVGIDDTIAFSDWLSERCGVIVAPGEYFGAPGHVRIGHALPVEDLTHGLDQLGEALRVFRGKAGEAARERAACSENL